MSSQSLQEKVEALQKQRNESFKARPINTKLALQLRIQQSSERRQKDLEERWSQRRFPEHAAYKKLMEECHHGRVTPDKFDVLEQKIYQLHPNQPKPCSPLELDYFLFFVRYLLTHNELFRPNWIHDHVFIQQCCSILQGSNTVLPALLGLARALAAAPGVFSTRSAKMMVEIASQQLSLQEHKDDSVCLQVLEVLSCLNDSMCVFAKNGNGWDVQGEVYTGDIISNIHNAVCNFLRTPNYRLIQAYFHFRTSLYSISYNYVHLLLKFEPFHQLCAHALYTYPGFESTPVYHDMLTTLAAEADWIYGVDHDIRCVLHFVETLIHSELFGGIIVSAERQSDKIQSAILLNIHNWLTITGGSQLGDLIYYRIQAIQETNQKPRIRFFPFQETLDNDSLGTFLFRIFKNVLGQKTSTTDMTIVLELLKHCLSHMFKGAGFLSLMDESGLTEMVQKLEYFEDRYISDIADNVMEARGEVSEAETEEMFEEDRKRHCLSEEEIQEQIRTFRNFEFVE